MSATPSILVTGDLIREVHSYQGPRRHASQPIDTGTRVVSSMGGAQLLHDLLIAAEPGVATLGLTVDASKAWPSYLTAYATYTPHAAGFKGDPKPPVGAKPEKVWRISTLTRYGHDDAVPPPEPPVARAPVSRAPALVVIDDSGAGFRTQRAKARWPYGATADESLPPWTLLKMSSPCWDGYLWRYLVDRCGTAAAGAQLMVVVSADELRRDGCAITRGLSWERTASDTCLALARHARFRGPTIAAHVIVVFRREGALWLRPSGAPATLIFDPLLAEGQWKSTLNEGGMVAGHLSAFTAAIALELAKSHPPDALHGAVVTAIERGLVAARELRLRGHGRVTKHVPSLPLAELGKAIKGEPVRRERHQPQDHFVTTSIAGCPQDRSLSTTWTIASRSDSDGKPIALYGLGFQTAIYGPGRLSKIPQARFGDLLSVDRGEMETLRGLRQMIQAYEEGGRQKQPLCIGAFGPPGAGKSFGIKQIAFEVFGSDVPLLEFNLSQFGNSSDLIGAFHQVRDKVLAGRTPVVFWDEFDSKQYEWLQLLLAPMQDGKFQSGQLTHSIGKCVFVFAGATSWDFEHFGPAPTPASQGEKDALDKLLANNREFVDKRAKGEEEFRLKKGPDFISRLSGFINVLGPNRRLLYDFGTGRWDRPDPDDVTFPIRRALLLRSFLKAKPNDELEFDRELLNALLRQPRYRHGARSMEKLVEPLGGAHASLRQAQLPPPQVLSQHLDDQAAFQVLLAENAAFLTPENLRALAAATHEEYRLRTERTYVHDPQFLDEYDKLDAWGRATNLAAAARIPYVLAVAGLCVRESKASLAETEAATRCLDRYLDALRREEHALWNQYVTANGWLQSPASPPVRVKDQLIHTCVLPFDSLDANDQKKDDDAIKSLAKRVDLVGFKIVPFSDLTM